MSRIELPEGDAAQAARGASIIVDVAESGGRTVERVADAAGARQGGAMIGVKKDFGDAQRRRHRDFRGDRRRRRRRALARKNVAWSLYKIDNDYQWFNVDGRWNFEPVKSSRKLADGRVDIAADAPAKFSARVGWGAHRLDVKSADGEETSFTFDVGWSGTASADTPDNVVVTLDKHDYAPGDDGETQHQLALRRQGDDRAGRRQARTLHRRRSRQGATMSCRSRSAPIGAPGAYAVAITHRPLDVGGEAHAGARHRRGLVRHRRGRAQARRRRSRRRTRRGRASTDRHSG